MNIRHWTRAAIAFGALAAFSGAASAQGIAGSPHDLSSGLDTNPDNNEVCVYCHTPHGARLDIEAPLWNKPAVSTTYTSYDSTTIDGDILAVGSVSIACLTCHDGSQAMDSVINAPGSGLNSSNIGTPAGLLIGNAVTNLGGDLSNDHPIGIQYGGFDPGTGQIDPDFKNTTNGLSSIGTGVDQRWWVDTTVGTAGSRDKTDMILYTRDNAGSPQPFVECASCHDPHVGNGTGAAGGPTGSTPDIGSDVNFMRIANVNSDVCLACHTK